MKVKRTRGRGQNRLVPVYLMTSTATHSILPGSAIVGDYESLVGRITIDFEGNRYGASNLIRFVERVHAAWERHTQKYPTVSRAYVQAHELSIVGTFDPLHGRVEVNPIDMPKLEEWLAMRPVPESELVL